MCVEIKDPSVSLHRILKDTSRRAKWLEALGLYESDLKQSTCICSRHFPDADDKKEPSLCLGKPYLAFPMCTRFLLLIGKQFASPIRQGPQAKCVNDRDEMRLLCLSTPALIVESRTEPASSELEMATMTSTGYQLQTAMIGQQLLDSDYHVHDHELPACDEPTNDSCSATINAALVAHIEMLEAENAKLKSQTEDQKYFRIECVEHDDNFVHLVFVYTFTKTITVMLRSFRIFGITF